ncbi:siderophore ABC transporter substrate-binding protein [Chromobacterium haemolyticum]|uniref:Siderophore ABC transporter substrate-binding protein n=1 Tax=Chromobacterium fluminis TaxID=3044269 RepID=A0ABX0L655_9NEIS|nr:siderophore ABC transporter substrate-binding protein [Chromobacterium haemolyticum]NHR05112.1 siderophore ABC transporter substrate-binding protein [Chromobacterium haemolyticum]
MSNDKKPRARAALLALAVAGGLLGCDARQAKSEAAAAPAAQAAYAPLTIKHELGTTQINKRPERVVAFDMSELDALDQLGAPVAGISKDYVAGFLKKYEQDPKVMDVGTTIQPNLERLHALKPDLILISPLQAQSYPELSRIAPTLHYDIDLNNRPGHTLDTAKEHLLTLGRILGKEALAREKAGEIDAKIKQVREVTAGRPEKALIVLHNNGAFTSYGVRSRYGYIFDTLGVKPASMETSSGLHGQPISNEFIQQADPDILYVIDRTAVMERRPALNLKTLDNPLLRQTKAWRNGKVIFADAETWYLCTASLSCLNRIGDEVIKGYRS